MQKWETRESFGRIGVQFAYLGLDGQDGMLDDKRVRRYIGCPYLEVLL